MFKAVLLLAPEVLLSKAEPIVESLQAIGGERRAEGGRVCSSRQPVGRRSCPESVGGL